jgi:predicted HicB family RNase H-like nuclease
MSKAPTKRYVLRLNPQMHMRLKLDATRRQMRLIDYADQVLKLGLRAVKENKNERDTDSTGNAA